MQITWSTEWSLNPSSWEDLKFECKGGSKQRRVPESAVINISHGECLTLGNPDSLQAQTLPALSPKGPSISPKKISVSRPQKPGLPAQEVVVPDDKHPSGD